MPAISQKKWHSAAGPAAEALDLLALHSEEILTAWRHELRKLDLDTKDVLDGVRIDFSALADLLRSSSYAEFSKQVQAFGNRLANRHVRLDRAVAALNRLIEICVLLLAQYVPRRATPILSLLRLHTYLELQIVSGYTGKWAGGTKTLAEASLSEVDYRRHEASAYVTRIYEQERYRLSRDLHDEVGHDLILIKLYLEMIALDVKNKATRNIQPRLNEAIAIVSHAIDAVRRLSLDLGPAVFDDLGFLPAVRFYAKQFSSRTKIDVALEEGYIGTDVPVTHQVALYRLLQGALSNVLKHASAKHVRISLRTEKDSELIMVIEDDGVGFDTEAESRFSFGLTAMRERVEVLGGTFQIRSTPAGAGKPHGTRIEVRLPLPAASV